MLNKVSAISTALALVSGAAAAGQIDGATYESYVNIEVAPVVSMWAAHENVSLVMDGADANNSATSESMLHVINNVDAKVDVSVSGSLPAPIVAGGGINFFIFNGGDSASAVSAITANAYNPAGALAWNHSSLGTTQTLIPSVGENTSIADYEIVYASAAPGEIPLPGDFDLTVTYEIIAN